MELSDKDGFTTSIGNGMQPGQERTSEENLSRLGHPLQQRPQGTVVRSVAPDPCEPRSISSPATRRQEAFPARLDRWNTSAIRSWRTAEGAAAIPRFTRERRSAPRTFPSPKIQAQPKQRRTPNDFEDQVVRNEADGNEGREPNDQENKENGAKNPEPAPCPSVAGHRPISIASMARIVYARTLCGNRYGMAEVKLNHRARLRNQCGHSDRPVTFSRRRAKQSGYREPSEQIAQTHSAFCSSRRRAQIVALQADPS